MFLRQFCETRKAKLSDRQKADLHYRTKLLKKAIAAMKCRPQWLKQVNAAVAVSLSHRNQQILRLF